MFCARYYKTRRQQRPSQLQPVKIETNQSHLLRY